MYKNNTTKLVKLLGCVITYYDFFFNMTRKKK